MSDATAGQRERLTAAARKFCSRSFRPISRLRFRVPTPRPAMTSLPENPSSTPTVTKHATGSTIEEEGSRRIGWYVLLGGRVGVYKQSVKIAEFAKHGEVFGEIGSILRQPRSARLVALEETKVAYFNCDLDQLVTEHPNVAKTMLISLARRLVKTTDDLWSARAE